jgi:hypothetical protein
VTAGQELAGTPLPPGTISIPAGENASLQGLLGSMAADESVLHPLYAYIAPQRGIGVGIDGLCALAGFDVADGPMLGSVDLECLTDLRADMDYRVEGEVISLVRKTGRKLGAFDLLTFRERLIDGDGTVAAVSTTSFVLPRGGRR